MITPGSERPALWFVDLEVDGRKVQVRERRDRDGLWLHWYADGGRRQPRLTGLSTVRTEDGVIDQARVKKAIRLARTQFRQALYGLQQESFDEDEKKGLTLEQGFDLALKPGVGRYPSKTARHKEVRRARARVLEGLGSDTLWTELRPRHYRLLWREFLARQPEWGQGWRMAEIAVSALAAVGAWLLDEDLVSSFRAPKRGWRGELRKEWQETAQKSAKPARPRHTDAEMDRFWGGMNGPDVDPRFGLAAEVGAEYRIGQVIRCDRSDLDLSSGAGSGFGTLEIHGVGRKPGALVFLSAHQRSVVDAALGVDPSNRGHLAAYEEAYQKGRLQDYPLFPAGKLRDGVLRPPRPGHPPCRMARRNLLKFFAAYEASVGIKHVPGRAWYGIRRRSSDRMRRVSTDERVRDAGGGWTPGSSTRERIYMDGQDPDVLQATATARELARGRDAANPTEATPADLEGVLRSMGLPEAKVQALLVMATPDPTAGS